MTARGGSNSAGAWPYGLALATWIASIPLVLFGGTVTTLRAGMAESGWLEPDGHFLWFYPLAMRVRDLGTFVEHHHREFGSLVGLLAIAAAIAAWRLETRPLARKLPFLALLAVCAQGAIGGFRVLKNDPDLAFLHGVLAQAVFALLAATALYLSPRWQATEPGACKTAPGLHKVTLAAAVLTFVQVALGAWFRHSGHHVGLALHVLVAVGVLGTIVGTARQMKEAVRQAEAGGADRRVLLGVVRGLLALVGLQILLGALATFFIYEVSGGMQAPVSVGEAVFATAHVFVGALLLAQTVAAAMWARRVVCAGEVPAAVRAEAAR